MEFENVNILECKFGLKVISAKYYDNRFGQNRSAEEREFPHPNLINARDAIKDDLAKAFYIEKDEVNHFTVTGFVINEKDDLVTVDIHGKMTNLHSYSTNVKSGKIPLDEEQEILKQKLELIKVELYKFLFEGKSAQGTLEGFPTSAKEVEQLDPPMEPVPTAISGDAEDEVIFPGTSEN